MTELQFQCKLNPFTYVTASKCAACKSGCAVCDALNGGYIEALVPTVNGRAIVKIFKVCKDGSLLHSGDVVQLDELLALSKACWYKPTLEETINKDFTVCFKGCRDKKQNKFIVRRYTFSDKPIIGIDLQTGEIMTLDAYMATCGYVEDDIVNIISNHENRKSRAYARMRSK